MNSLSIISNLLCMVNYYNLPWINFESDFDFPSWCTLCFL